MSERPFSTPDQDRAAEKRREATGNRSAKPEERHAPEGETVTAKRAAKKKS